MKQLVITALFALTVIPLAASGQRGKGPDKGKNDTAMQHGRIESVKGHGKVSDDVAKKGHGKIDVLKGHGKTTNPSVHDTTKNHGKDYNPSVHDTIKKTYNASKFVGTQGKWTNKSTHDTAKKKK